MKNIFLQRRESSLNENNLRNSHTSVTVKTTRGSYHKRFRVNLLVE